ncbi:hypothetical protein [Nocardia asteroides]|uniref:hypothetical protein n=1 Tax=Nocardia asteroides TaxID=1824 RepID=UPI0033D9B295
MSRPERAATVQTLALILTPVLGLVGVLAGVAGTWHVAQKKARAEAADAARDDELARRQLDQAQFTAMLDSQRKDFEAIVSPIRADVESLRREVATLNTLVDRLRTKYRAALDWAERLWHWAQARPDADTAPARPAILADEVG